MKLPTEKLWDVGAEAAVLGSMIIDPQCIGSVIPILDGKSFFRPENQTIYDALVSLYLHDISIDAIILRAKLKELDKLEEIGGVTYIGRLMDSVASSANVLYYAGIVKDRQQYRKLVRTCDEMKALLAEPLTIDEMLQQIQFLALGLDQHKQSAEYYTFARDAEKVQDEAQESKSYIPTGFRNIDRLIDGVASGELIVIAGRPSMGKSVLALQTAMNMAKRGLSILFFSLEMTHRALIERSLKQLQISELKKLDFILHEGGQTPEKQVAFLKTHKADVVFVDYLQLMNTTNKSENRVQEISQISRQLKLSAIKENVPIVALSQLNRAVENRDKHRPRLSDLRESGAIEQDADVVLLIHREDYYRRIADPKAPQDGSTEINIAKNRRGPTGLAELVFLDEKVCFGDKTNFSETLI